MLQVRIWSEICQTQRLCFHVSRKPIIAIVVLFRARSRILQFYNCEMNGYALAVLQTQLYHVWPGAICLFSPWACYSAFRAQLTGYLTEEASLIIPGSADHSTPLFQHLHSVFRWSYRSVSLRRPWVSWDRDHAIFPVPSMAEEAQEMFSKCLKGEAQIPGIRFKWTLLKYVRMGLPTRRQWISWLSLKNIIKE